MVLLNFFFLEIRKCLLASVRHCHNEKLNKKKSRAKKRKNPIFNIYPYDATENWSILGYWNRCGNNQKMGIRCNEGTFTWKSSKLGTFRRTGILSRIPKMHMSALWKNCLKYFFFVDQITTFTLNRCCGECRAPNWQPRYVKSKISWKFKWIPTNMLPSGVNLSGKNWGLSTLCTACLIEIL